MSGNPTTTTGGDPVHRDERLRIENLHSTTETTHSVVSVTQLNNLFLSFNLFVSFLNSLFSTHKLFVVSANNLFLSLKLSFSSLNDLISCDQPFTSSFHFAICCFNCRFCSKSKHETVPTQAL